MEKGPLRVLIVDDHCKTAAFPGCALDLQVSADRTDALPNAEQSEPPAHIARTMLDAGAEAFVSKTVSAGELLEAIYGSGGVGGADKRDLKNGFIAPRPNNREGEPPCGSILNGHLQKLGITDR